MRSFVNEQFPSKSKETYLFVFSSQLQANYWMLQTSVKLHTEILFRDRYKHRIEFSDSIYYFKSENELPRLKCIHFDHVYPSAAIYIILDDPERFRIKEDN